MKNKEEIKECKLLIAIGEGDATEVIFAAKIFPNGRVGIDGNAYYQPLINHVLGRVAPSIQLEVKSKKNRAERRLEEREKAKILKPTAEDMRCLRQ